MLKNMRKLCNFKSLYKYVVESRDKIQKRSGSSFGSGSFSRSGSSSSKRSGSHLLDPKWPKRSGSQLPRVRSGPPLKMRHCLVNGHAETHLLRICFQEGSFLQNMTHKMWVFEHYVYMLKGKGCVIVSNWVKTFQYSVRLLKLNCATALMYRKECRRVVVVWSVTCLLGLYCTCDCRYQDWCAVIL